MAEFGLKKSFEIDNGQLDGLSPQECFVLGYELAKIDDMLESEVDGFDQICHTANRQRIVKSCRDAGRKFRCVSILDSEWMTLQVDPLSW